MNTEVGLAPHRLERLRSLTEKLDELSGEAYTILDAIPDLVCIWQGRRILFANKAFEATLGFTREEVQDRRWVEFLHPDDVEHTLAIARAGETIGALENRWVASDGRVVPIRWVATAPSPKGYSLAIGSPMEAERGAG